MTDLRTAAQQALEALVSQFDGRADAIDILSAALAQQAEPGEPVAWYYERDTDKGLSFAPDRDPYKCWQPLTTPRPQRKPLTSDKDRPDQGATYVEGYGYVDTRAVRAVERAHGIGGA